MDNPYQDWSDEELKKHSELMWKVLSERRKESDQKKQRELNINGITAKDILVIGFRNLHCDGGTTYSFRIVHDGKEYDIYYDGIEHDADEDLDCNWGYYSWWPVRKNRSDRYEANGARDFIPDDFSEESENSYSFDGTENQATKYLKKHGITNIRFQDL